MKDNIWKPIIGFEGLYEITNTGKIMSLLKQKKELKPVLQSTGYISYTLSKNKIRLQTLAHRLVALNFIPNPKNKPCVNHLNGIRNDNRVENLEWCTHSENINHAIRNGFMTFKRGKDHPSFGTTQSEEVKNKKRQTMLKNACNTKEYTFIKNDEKITFINMNKFCRENDLHVSCMHLVLNKSVSQHKGYMLT